MSGQRDLRVLLKEMDPELVAGDFVFVSVPPEATDAIADLSPIALCREEEGVSLIVPKSSADHAGLTYAGTFRKITLRVHSSLHAVGLTAAIADACAKHNISVNVVAAFHHDHLFVPSLKAQAALDVLRALSTSNE